MPAAKPITPQLADEAIDSRLARAPVESLPLALCVGRTLRESIYAERDHPPFDRVCMDGVAVSSEALRRGLRRFNLQATQGAGSPALTLERSDNAIEVMTGAVLPVAADSVIPVEQYELADGVVSITSAVVTTAYHNVQSRAIEGSKGALLLESGTVLRAPEVAVIASAGLAQVRVSAQPTVVIISTGDELIEPGATIAAHQVRRSNAYAIAAALRQHGFARADDDHVLDEEAMMRERLATHLATHDVLILSGGVSMGKFDFVPKVLTDLGVREVFHKIAQKPGQPMWFGVGPRGQAVFGLPGNPVSTLICLGRYVIPALSRAMGATPKAPPRVALAMPVECPRPSTYFVPVSIQEDRDGRLWAHPRHPNGSGDFLSLTATDGFVEVPPGPKTYPQGFVVSLYRW